MARQFTDNDAADDTEWTFGQILPVFLLAGPIVSIALSIPIEPPGLTDKRGKLLNWLQAWLPNHNPSRNPDGEDHSIMSHFGWGTDCMTGPSPIQLTNISQVPYRNRSHQPSASTIQAELVSDTNAFIPGDDQSRNQSNAEVGHQSMAGQNESLYEQMNSSEGFEPFNQDLTSSEDDAGTIKTRLCNYYLHSRWMSFCFGFVWLHILAVTSLTLFCLLYFNQLSQRLASAAFVVFVFQPIALFSATTLGLYITDYRRTKVVLWCSAILHCCLWGLTVFGILMIVFDGRVLDFEPRSLATAPLIVLVGLSFYLNLVN
jgi:hypothetical protein